MKKLLIISVLLLFAIVSFSQKITRGPDIGEIYFLGPTNNGEGLYYSTDFGETATFVDGSMNFISIAADKTQGGVYCVTLPTALYYSNEFGYSNTWEFKFSNSYLSYFIFSGVNIGHVFSDCYMHSEDFGSSFIVHSLNGWFGSLKNASIDNIDENIGYAITKKTTVADTVYFFRTYDTFENIELIYKLNYPWYEDFRLRRGVSSGEVFLFDFTQNKLLISSDYMDNLNLIESFNFTTFYQIDMVGGQQEGELYVLYNFVNMMWQNAHIYIFHSTDYGKTFEVFHPFAKGNEPVLANFSTDTTEGEMPFTVEFCNFSIGDIQQYEWDFENDGIIDSYEQSPSYIYADTGLYSVRLTITGPDSSNTFLKENYIHVKKITGLNEVYLSEINCFPNPFTDKTTLNLSDNKMKWATWIFIFNIHGENVKTINTNNKLSVSWDGTDCSGKKLSPGIYYCKTNAINTSAKKLLLTH